MQDDRLGGARRENRLRRRPSPTTDPADPTASGALPRTRKRLERTITDDPAHHTRETHRTPPNNSTGEEDAFEQTVHHNLRAPRLQKHPRIIFRVCYASFAPLRSSTLHCTRKKGVAEGEEA